MLKQKLDQKGIEFRYIEEAPSSSCIFPSGELVNHEIPDFLLHTHTGTIGIEITELCREGPRAVAGKLAKIPNAAKESYTRKHDKPVDVSVAFSDRAESLSFKNLKRSLAKFVLNNSNKDETVFTRNLPEGYCHIGIFAPLEPSGRWRGFVGFDTVITPKELIEDRILVKNNRVPEYRVSSPEVWLLIVNDQILGAGEVYTDPDHLATWKFDFDFEKVLLFLREPGGTGKVFELQNHK